MIKGRSSEKSKVEQSNQYKILRQRANKKFVKIHELECRVKRREFSEQRTRFIKLYTSLRTSESKFKTSFATNIREALCRRS